MARASGVDVAALGRGIRERRLALNLSLSDLERRSGVASSYVSKLERGLSPRPGAERLERIAEALGLSDWRQLLQPPSGSANPSQAEERPVRAIATSGPDERPLSEEGQRQLRAIIREEFERIFRERGMPPPTEDELP